MNYRAAVGLGNPGSEYHNTRHNLGGRVVEDICNQYGLRFKPGKGSFYYSEKGNLLFVRPTTYMNSSGIAVLDLVNIYSLSPEDILIVLDDIDLPFGKLRLKCGGSSAGHNGLSSVIYHLNTEEIPRLRIGIGRPEVNDEVKWVLSNFTEEEESQLDDVIKVAKEGLMLWYNEDIGIAMSQIN